MQCPICKKNIEAEPGEERPKFYPFCSERCRLIDLGRWLDGKYQVAAAPRNESREDSAQQ